MSVNIIGDRTVFLSKTAILRLKSDVKENKAIDSSKYLKAGYSFKIENNNNIINATIIQNDDLRPQEGLVTDQESVDKPNDDAEIKKQELHKKLKQQLRDSRKDRSGESKRKMTSMKNTVPTKILDCYTKLMSKYKLDNLPSPDDVIKNVDKYKLQISAVMGKIGKVSDDPRVSKCVLDYFTALGNHLNIEPMNIDLSNNANMENIANMAAASSDPRLANIASMARVQNKDDDTDEEDAPELVLKN